MARLNRDAPAEPVSTPAVDPVDSRYDDMFDGDEGTVAKPVILPRDMSLMTIHPRRWGVVEGEVIPIVGHFKMLGGVGEVVQLRNGKFRISRAAANLGERGWRVLPLKIDGRPYMHEPAPGVHLSRWETLHEGQIRPSVDTKGYVKWLRGLLKQGLIARAAPNVLEDLAERYRAELSAAIDAAETQPSQRAVARRLQAAIEAVEDELRLIRGPAIKSGDSSIDLDEEDPDGADLLGDGKE